MDPPQMRTLSPAIAVTIALALAGCGTAPSARIIGNEAVPPAERTITVPAGANGLVGTMKEALSATGWKMSVDRGPDVLKGTVGEKTNLASGSTFLTRYRMAMKWRIVDYCSPYASGLVNPEIAYDLSVIDNKDGHEVLTQSGRACENVVAPQFVDRLNGVPPPSACRWFC